MIHTPALISHRRLTDWFTGPTPTVDSMHCMHCSSRGHLDTNTPTNDGRDDCKTQDRTRQDMTMRHFIVRRDPKSVPLVRDSVRKYVFYVFSLQISKKRDFYGFFEMACQKVVSKKRLLPSDAYRPTLVNLYTRSVRHCRSCALDHPPSSAVTARLPHSHHATQRFSHRKTSDAHPGPPTTLSPGTVSQPISGCVECIVLLWRR